MAMNESELRVYRYIYISEYIYVCIYVYISEVFNREKKIRCGFHPLYFAFFKFTLPWPKKIYNIHDTHTVYAACRGQIETQLVFIKIKSRATWKLTAWKVDATTVNETSVHTKFYLFIFTFFYFCSTLLGFFFYFSLLKCKLNFAYSEESKIANTKASISSWPCAISLVKVFYFWLSIYISFLKRKIEIYKMKQQQKSARNELALYESFFAILLNNKINFKIHTTFMCNVFSNQELFC